MDKPSSLTIQKELRRLYYVLIGASRPPTGPGLEMAKNHFSFWLSKAREEGLTWKDIGDTIGLPALQAYQIGQSAIRRENGGSDCVLYLGPHTKTLPDVLERHTTATYSEELDLIRPPQT